MGSRRVPRAVGGLCFPAVVPGYGEQSVESGNCLSAAPAALWATCTYVTAKHTRTHTHKHTHKHTHTHRNTHTNTHINTHTVFPDICDSNLQECPLHFSF